MCQAGSLRLQTRMAAMKVYLGVALIVIACASAVSGIKCWECIDNEATPNDYCEDPFNVTKGSALAANMTKDCPYGCVKGKNGKISSVLGTYSWDEMRGCYDPTTDPYGEARGEGCRYNYDTTVTFVQHKGEAGCFCKSDYCNGASTLGGVFAVVMLYAMGRFL